MGPDGSTPRWQFPCTPASLRVPVSAPPAAHTKNQGTRLDTVSTSSPKSNASCYQHPIGLSPAPTLFPHPTHMPRPFSHPHPRHRRFPPVSSSWLCRTDHTPQPIPTRSPECLICHPSDWVTPVPETLPRLSVTLQRDSRPLLLLLHKPPLTSHPIPQGRDQSLWPPSSSSAASLHPQLLHKLPLLLFTPLTFLILPLPNATSSARPLPAVNFPLYTLMMLHLSPLRTL